MLEKKIQTVEEPDIADEPSAETIHRKPLRLWPGVLIVALQLLANYVLPRIVPAATVYAAIGGVFVGALAIVVWWMFFSRAPKLERWGAVPLMIIAMIVAFQLIDDSIATASMGMAFIFLAIPILSLAFVVWAVASRRLSDRPRRVTMVATILLATGVWAFLRSDGITGDGSHQITWRWADTAEERLLERTRDMDVPPLSPTETVAKEGPVWPGFRGPERNGIIPGVQIETDWSSYPPVELWRRRIGPGWSSFAVTGDLFYTQEQRGENELVSCYTVSTGEPVWRHSDAARFWDSHAGAGPRGTPTLHDGRLYTFGATGILNALDASTGDVIWSRNAAADAEVKLPDWGFTSSPLVVGELVIVAAEGVLVAYDLATGKPRWFGPKGGWGFSSPHLSTIDGVAQVLLLRGLGVTSVTPDEGEILWEHPWHGAYLLQPALIPGTPNEMLISAEDMTGSAGVRRVAVQHGPDGWTTEERWTSKGLKPSFSDFVIHKGHAYGFDGRILACIRLGDGERQWKGGRYGSGQLVLLSDQDLLLVISEQGELALVNATPDQFTELARLPAIEGKTWTHPALVDDVLLVRNAREMAAFRLSPTKD